MYLWSETALGVQAAGDKLQHLSDSAFPYSLKSQTTIPTLGIRVKRRLLRGAASTFEGGRVSALGGAQDRPESLSYFRGRMAVTIGGDERRARDARRLR